MWWTPCWELGLEEAVLTSEGTEAARGSNRNPGTVSGTVSVLSGKSGTVLTKPENIDNLFFNLLRKDMYIHGTSARTEQTALVSIIFFMSGVVFMV